MRNKYLNLQQFVSTEDAMEQDTIFLLYKIDYEVMSFNGQLFIATSYICF